MDSKTNGLYHLETIFKRLNENDNKLNVHYLLLN